MQKSKETKARGAETWNFQLFWWLKSQQLIVVFSCHYNNVLLKSGLLNLSCGLDSAKRSPQEKKLNLDHIYLVIILWYVMYNMFVILYHRMGMWSQSWHIYCGKLIESGRITVQIIIWINFIRTLISVAILKSYVFWMCHVDWIPPRDRRKRKS